MIRVLFVCYANVCRSPMAEAVFQHLVAQAGLQEQIEADSAGVTDWEIDTAPHPGTLSVLEENGIRYEGHGRNFVRGDLNDFDYIITMDEENLQTVRKFGKGRATVSPLLSFVKGAPFREVPDPYFDHGFDIVYNIIHTGVVALLSHIRHRHRL